MQALYCLIWQKLVISLFDREKAFCRLSGRNCESCRHCVFKMIEEDDLLES